MRTANFELSDGIRVGEQAHCTVVIKELNAGELLDAKLASEDLHMVPAGFDERGQPVHLSELVVSPMKMAVETLRRQVVSVGIIQGPLEMEMLRNLSVNDLNKLLHEAEELDVAASLEVAQQRGRSDSGSGADSETN